MIAPPRPRIPAAMARRLDRLARRAHLFHRYAHHPLCVEYEGEVIRFGIRVRLCRGCTFAVAGGIVGATAGALLPLPPVMILWSLAAAGAAWMVWLTRPSQAATQGPHRIPAPRPKVFTRFAPAAALGMLLLFAARLGGSPGAGLSLAGLGLLAAALRRYRARGPQRLPCATCPEATGPVPCRGYQEIHLRERAFARLARRWMDPAPAHGGGDSSTVR